MTDDTPDNIVPRSVIMPDGRVAVLWWPTRLPIPPGYTVVISPLSSVHARAHEFEFVRSH